MKSIKSIIKEELARIINEDYRKEYLLSFFKKTYNKNIPLELEREDYQLINDDLASFIYYIDSRIISELLNYSSNPDATAIEIVRLKNKNLDYNDVLELLKNSSNKDEIANAIVDVIFNNLQDLLSPDRKLNPFKTLDTIFKYLSNPDAMIDKIIKLNKSLYGKKLAETIVNILLEYSSNKDETAEKIINAKGNALNYFDISHILKHSSDQNKYRIITKIINAKVNQLDRNDIKYILQFTPDSNKEKIKNLLIQAGVDRSLIQ